jgi:hypothetical protein
MASGTFDIATEGTRHCRSADYHCGTRAKGIFRTACREARNQRIARFHLRAFTSGTCPNMGHQPAAWLIRRASKEEEGHCRATGSRTGLGAARLV